MRITRFVLSLFILLSLMAIAFPLTPRTSQAADGTYYYDFIAHAAEAGWSSGAGSLPFPGNLDDSRGFACYRDNIRTEDGSTYSRVLETHPQWIQGGYISGRYPEVTVMPGTELYLRVGFLEGAEGTDGVTFQVYFHYQEGETPTQSTVTTRDEEYDKNLYSWYYPLDGYAGKTGQFRLVVLAGPSSGKDWAIWAKAEIRPSGVIVTTDCPLPDATRGTAYSAQLEAVGAEVLPYHWAGVDGSLPPGLSLNSNTGAISGTPTATGIYSFRVRACDSTELDGPRCSQSKDCHIRVIESGETPPPAQAFDFGLSVSPAEVSIDLDPLVSGATCTAEAKTTTTVSLVSGIAQTVSLSLSGGVPSHVSSYCLPHDGLPPFTSECGFTVYCTGSLPATGDYTATLTATGGGISRTKTIKLHIVRGVYGDLDVVSVEPVQVVYGAPLVAGKATVFRAKVRSTFQVPVETDLKLELPEGYWTTSPPSTGRLITGIPPDWEYPEIWGPVTIDPGDNEIMLPIIPAGHEDATWPGEPAGVIEGVCVSGICGPDVRVVPRPKDVSMATYTVELDPYNVISETNERNNEYYASAQVVTTRGYSFAVFRVNATIIEPAACPSVASVPSFESAAGTFKDNLEYLLGTFPIADSKVSYSIMPTVVSTEVEPREPYLRMIYRMAASEGYDWAVGLTCGCCGGTVYWDTKAVSIGNSTTNIHNLAHEASHITSVVGAPDCYGCGRSDVDCASCRNSEGFWVNAWQEYPRETPPSTWNVTRDGNWSTNEWLRLCYYMDFSDYAPYCWIGLDPVRYDNGSRSTDGYLNLITELSDSRDPDAILVSGAVYQDNTIVLDPFIRIGDATLDIEAGSEGDYYIVLLDKDSRILGKSGFFVGFYETAQQPDSGMVEMDQAGFAYVVEWQEGTNRIEIQDKDGSVLASRDVSPNKPDIRILHPNDGEAFAKGEMITARWQASDADGDALTYSLAISMDSGETWLPIDIDINGNEYELDTAVLEVGQDYLIKVRATDGVNTAEDVSDAAFTITEKEEAEEGGISTWVFIVILATVVIGFAVYLGTRRKRA